MTTTQEDKSTRHVRCLVLSDWTTGCEQTTLEESMPIEDKILIAIITVWICVIALTWVWIGG